MHAVILQTLQDIFSHQYCHFSQIDSTNTRLLSDIANNQRPHDDIWLYTADTQNAGRGQHGRTWVSGKGNIFLSLYIPLQSATSHTLSLQELSGLLSLIVGYHLSQLTIIYNINQHRQVQNLPIIGVKWANDLGFYDDKRQQFQKLAGILIEPAFKKITGKSVITGVVIGVGLNVKSTPTIHDGLYQATSLADLTTQHLNHHTLYQPIVEALLFAINTHNTLAYPEQLDTFVDAFNQRHILNGRLVQIFLQDNMQHIHAEGICQDIANNGGLILQTGEQTTKIILAGMAQIKKDLS